MIYVCETRVFLQILGSMLMSGMTRPASALLLLLLLPSLPAHADVIGLARVVDGDTIHIDKTKIRLYGIDAPEAKQTCKGEGTEWACGQAATKAMIDAINGQIVTCRGDKRDRYKRLLAVCYVGNMNLNAMMVLNGWALAYRKYSTDYVDAEAVAEKARVGLWRGEFEKPWEWRRR